MNSSLLNKIITSENSLLSLIESSDDNFLITYINQHCFNTSFSDREYLDQLTSDFKIYADGVGLYLSLKFLGFHPLENFNASDLNQKAFDFFIKNRTPIYILGGKFDKSLIVPGFTQKGLNVKGYSNGYKDTDSLEELALTISKSCAEVITLGISVPKQEKIAHALFKLLPEKSFLCVGNFLEFYLGTQKRAPEFLRNSGFEWLFRLLTEPKRLWKRYLLGIPLFIFRIIKIKFTLPK
ncbi:MAG: WecB/TagA/CpsF family glycosyltransferase [Ignavibacteriaceae bacterium]